MLQKKLSGVKTKDDVFNFITNSPRDAPLMVAFLGLIGIGMGVPHDLVSTTQRMAGPLKYGLIPRELNSKHVRSHSLIVEDERVAILLLVELYQYFGDTPGEDRTQTDAHT